MKKVSLTRGMEAIVDDDYYDLIMRFKWHYHSTGYAMHTYEGGKKLRMHHVILPCLPGLYVDHINGNKLDNRKSNLRHVTPTQSAWNLTMPSHNTSGYKGVFWRVGSQKWQAKIRVEKKDIHLGLYSSKEDAALAYNAAANKYHGEYAKYNKVPGYKIEDFKTMTFNKRPYVRSSRIIIPK